MRRRFEKRVYIALPEAHARTSMFKLNLGDTPNEITPEEFEEVCTGALLIQGEGRINLRLGFE